MNPPSITIPPLVRLVIYVAGAVGAAVVAYSATKGWIGDAEIALWASLAAIPNVLAAANVTTKRRRADQ